MTVETLHGHGRLVMMMMMMKAKTHQDCGWTHLHHGHSTTIMTLQEDEWSLTMMMKTLRDHTWSMMMMMTKAKTHPDHGWLLKIRDGPIMVMDNL